MLDKSRMTLCLALLALFVINPLASFVNPDLDPNFLVGGDSSAMSRTILGLSETWSDPGAYGYSWKRLFEMSASTLIISTSYLVVFLLTMVAIFVYGEAQVPEHSTSMQSFWVHRKQADNEIKEQANLTRERAQELRHHLSLALHSLGRPVPSGRVELWLSVLWQVVHQALHRIGFARWFVRRAGGFQAESKTRALITTARKECAIAYHQLHQVHLALERKDHLTGLYLALTAVNLAEASGTAVASNFRCHVYALLSLRIRHSLPRFVFKFLARFYMFKAKRRHANSEMIDAGLAWLMTKEGQEFAAQPHWFFGQNTGEFTSVPDDSLNPLAVLGRYFREEQLTKALSIAVSPGSAEGEQIGDGLELVRKAEVNNSSVDIGVLKPCQDSLSRWWSAVLAIAYHWMLDEKEKARQLYRTVESYEVS